MSLTLVDTLRQQCLQALRVLVERTILRVELEPWTVDEVRRYLAPLPGMALEDLLEAVPAKMDDSLPARARMRVPWSMHRVVVLLRCDVTRLTVTSLSIGHLERVHEQLRVVQGLREHGSGLRTLDLDGMWLKASSMAALVEAVADGALRQLRDLTVCPNDELVKAVGMHCPHLHCLTLLAGDAVSDKGIRALCCSPAAKSLQILEVGSLDFFSEMLVARCLFKMPKLQSFGYCEWVGYGLLLLEEQRNGPYLIPETFKLKNIVDSETTVNSLERMIRLCPSLHSVELRRPKKDVVRQLGSLPALTTVRLDEFDVDELVALLNEAGHRLTELELNCNFMPWLPIQKVDLGRLASTCRSLTSLKVCGADCEPTELLPVAWPPSLHTLHFGGCRISAGGLVRAVRAARSLRTLDVWSCSLLDLQDSHIADLCAAGNELRRVWLETRGSFRLTAAAVRTFIARSPSLVSLKGIKSWSVSTEELEALCAEQRQRNCGVALG